MSNAFVKIEMCYVYNQWYDISCAILYNYNCLGSLKLHPKKQGKPGKTTEETFVCARAEGYSVSHLRESCMMMMISDSDSDSDGDAISADFESFTV